MSFVERVDLAAERLGGAVVYATDDFFAAKENLLKPGRGEFIPGKYTENGKWMDGWESRRKRTPGHDFCIVRLGLPGIVRGVDADTNHFLGNAPKSVMFEAAYLPGFTPTSKLLADDMVWTPLLAESAVKPGSQNLFAIESDKPWTHLRFHIYPDGGVARLRVYGDVVANWSRLLAEHRVLDLAAMEHGGAAVLASDSFFSDKNNLVLPGRSLNMGDGWETKRRRGPGYDWAIVKLGRPGKLARAVVETTHYKGNFPDTCSLEACYARNASLEDLQKEGLFKELLPRQKLEAHTLHEFESELLQLGPVSHVRLNIYPDGGVARLRLFGVPE